MDNHYSPQFSGYNSCASYPAEICVSSLLAQSCPYWVNCSVRDLASRKVNCVSYNKFSPDTPSFG